jgi:hypothetical protein
MEHGPPKGEHDGHEWQFYDPAPGKLKEEEVKELTKHPVQEPAVAPPNGIAVPLKDPSGTVECPSPWKSTRA